MGRRSPIPIHFHLPRVNRVVLCANRVLEFLCISAKGTLGELRSKLSAITYDEQACVQTNLRLSQTLLLVFYKQIRFKTAVVRKSNDFWFQSNVIARNLDLVFP
jgi:hypothetical protein